eukprot:1487875-Prymnesium_polylepis.1
MMHTPWYSPTDQGICAGLSRWGPAPSCVSGSMHARTAAEGAVNTCLLLVDTPSLRSLRSFPGAPRTAVNMLAALLASTPSTVVYEAVAVNFTWESAARFAGSGYERDNNIIVRSSCS